MVVSLRAMPSDMAKARARVQNVAAIGVRYGMLRRLNGLSFVLGTMLSMPRIQMAPMIRVCGGTVIVELDAGCFFVYSDAVGLSDGDAARLRSIGAYGMAESAFAQTLLATPEELEPGANLLPFVDALPAGLVHGWPA